MDDKFRKEVDEFLQGGLELEGKIVFEGQAIRQKSKECYGKYLLDSRLTLVSIVNYILTLKSMEPGNTDQDITERLILTTTFFQGIPATEELISEGQYIKAAGALKQDYEIITRLITIRHGKHKYGKLANIQNAPDGSQKSSGDLNDISHISKSDILQDLLSEHIDGEAKGLSPIPSLNGEITKNLYEFHVWLLFEAVREQILLFIEMYGEETKGFEKAAKWFVHANELMKKAGFEVESTI